MHKFDWWTISYCDLSPIPLAECMSNRTIDNVQWLCSITSLWNDCYSIQLLIGKVIENWRESKVLKEIQTTRSRFFGKYVRISNSKCKKCEWLIWLDLTGSILSIAMTNWKYLTSYSSFNNMNDLMPVHSLRFFVLSCLVSSYNVVLINEKFILW